MIITMNPIASLQLLGGLKVCCGDHLWTRFRTQKAGELLAYLAYHCHKAHSREHLITLLWEDVPLETGRNRLNVTLYVLRSQFKMLGAEGKSLLLTDRNSVQLNAECVQVDTAEFEKYLAESARLSDAAVRLIPLQKACALYGGALLPEFYADWISAEQARLSARFIQALRQMAECYETLGDLENAQETLRRAAQEEPLNEEICREQMRIAVRRGEPALALRCFQELERQMREQLGLTPSAETHRLADSLRNGSFPSQISQPETKTEFTGPSVLPLPTIPAPLPKSPPQIQPLTSISLPRRWRYAAVGIAVIAVCLAAKQFVIAPRKHLPLPRPAETGGLLWTQQIKTASDEKELTPISLLTDAAGNLYVTGIAQTDSHDADILTLKYNPNGRLLWKARFNSDANDCDRPFDLALDANGNLYVAGESYCGDREQGKTQWDTILLKYTSNGKFCWRRHFNQRPGNDDHGRRVAVNAAGFVYVGAWTETAQKRKSMLLIKYDGDGELLWSRPYLPPALPGNPVETELNDMALDSAGNVTLAGAGQFNETGERTLLCALTLRYDRNGNLLWQRKFSGDTNGMDRAWRTAPAPDGGVFVAGSGYLHKVPAGKNSEGFFVIRYDASGQEQWVVRTQAGAYPNILSGIAVTPTGDCIVSGIGGSADRATVKIDKDGKLLWRQVQSSRRRQWAMNLVGWGSDKTGCVWVLNSEADPTVTGLAWQYVLSKYAPDSTLLAQIRTPTVIKPTTEGNWLAVTGDGKAYLAAQTAEGLTFWKYSLPAPVSSNPLRN